MINIPPPNVLVWYSNMPEQSMRYNIGDCSEFPNVYSDLRR